MSEGGKLITIEDILAAHNRIKSHLKKTPIVTSSNLDALTGKSLYFKCENFQSTGSFKVRGAMNSLLLAMEKHGGKLKGVATESSGNHGQAQAWAASKFGIKCVVVVPEGAPEAKLQAIRHYGGEIVNCEATLTARTSEMNRVANELGYEIILPHNAYNTMAGQGTIALEFLEQVPEMDAIIVSVGGGGMGSGVAACVKALAPNIKVFLAEPEGKNLQRQLEKGVRENKGGGMLKTIADGIRVDEVGDNCFPNLVAFCEKTVFPITEEEIKHSTRLIWERLKVVVEPSAALPLAAVLKYKDQLKDFHRIGLLLCGGNMNMDKVL